MNICISSTMEITKKEKRQRITGHVEVMSMRKERIQNNIVFGLIGIGENSTKLVEDFRYIFADRLHLGDTIVWKAKQTDPEEKHEAYICCTYDRRQAAGELKKAGLRYRKEYFFAEDLFPLLDDWKDCRIAYKAYPGDRKGWIRAIVFGYAARHGIVLPGDSCRDLLKGRYDLTGRQVNRRGRKWLSYLFCLFFGALEAGPQIFEKSKGYKGYAYLCFVSAGDAVRYKQEHPISGIRLITVDELKAHTMASLYMRAVYFDRRQNSISCDTPFHKLWIGMDGMTRLCDCPDYLEIGYGNAGVTELSEIWESPLAKIVRLSAVNHTYTFCSRQLCGRFHEHPDRTVLQQRMDIAGVEKYPRTLMVANDRVCNLHCPSCRKKVHAKNDRNEEMGNNACREALLRSGWPEQAQELIIGGSGEVFLSQNYKAVLYEGERKRNYVDIMTNGTLFTPKEWEKLEGKYEYICFSVSIDAVTKETYEKVRCGGSFERLMENMAFLSALRREKKVDLVRVNMIVQEANYREIPEFIRWTKHMGFDGVNLSHIRNWGTYSEKEFTECVSMFDGNGNMKAELAKVLEDPICSDPIVHKNWEGW